MGYPCHPFAKGGSHEVQSSILRQMGLLQASTLHTLYTPHITSYNPKCPCHVMFHVFLHSSFLGPLNPEHPHIPTWGFPKITVTIFGDLYIQGYTVLVSILGSPCFGKLPYILINLLNSCFQPVPTEHWSARTIAAVRCGPSLHLTLLSLGFIGFIGFKVQGL